MRPRTLGMTTTDLLDLPLEVVHNIFQFLPGIDLKSVALTCSAALNIVAPTLFQTIRLFYDESPEKTKDGLIGLPVLSDVENIMASSELPLGYARRFRLQRKGPRILTGRRSRKEKPEVSATAERAIELVLKRFKAGQLRSIKFDHETSPSIYSFLCSHQTNLKDLDLGDIRVGGSAHLSRLIFKGLASSSSTLESLEICEVDQKVTSINTALGIINHCAPTLRRLRIGSASHTRNSAGSTSSRSGREPTPSIKLIILQSLEQFTIVHDEYNKRFMESLKTVARFTSKLASVRISCCTEPHRLAHLLVQRGANNIKSLQITSGLVRLTRGLHENLLPRISGLQTLQVPGCPFDKKGCSHHEGLFQAVYAHRSTLKRLWLPCSLRCDAQGKELKPPNYNGLYSPGKTKGMIDISGLKSEQWPMLEELAILEPRWTSFFKSPAINELPMLKSLKILRLILWKDPPMPNPGPQDYFPKLDLYVEHLHQWCTSSQATSWFPNLRVIVVDTAPTKSRGCPEFSKQSTANEPLYFVLYSFLGREYGDMFPPFVVNVTKEVARRECRDMGCSTYLLEPGPPAPDRFWGDQDVRLNCYD